MAKATCDSGKVAINDAVARAGHIVRAGDVISVLLPERRLTFRIASVPSKAPGKSESRAMIEILENRRIGDSED
jgi:ribosomal 50S subunit-recycling heat shock protein